MTTRTEVQSDYPVRINPDRKSAFAKRHPVQIQLSSVRGGLRISLTLAEAATLASDLFKVTSSYAGTR